MKGDPKRILAVTIGGLGDAILFSPVVRALRRRFEHAGIDLLVASRLVQEVYTCAAEIDRTVFVDTSRRLSLMRMGALLSYALRSRVGGGYDIGALATGLNPHFDLFFKYGAGVKTVLRAPAAPSFGTDLRCNLAMAKRFDVGADKTDVFIPLTDASKREARRALKASGLEDECGRLIAVYLSADLRRRPRWALSHMAEVVRLLKEHGRRRKIVVVGSEQEGKEWAGFDTDALADANLAGRLTILGSASLLQECRLAICNDGGMMHVAGAVGCPLVAIMPNTPLSYRPAGDRVIVFHPHGRRRPPLENPARQNGMQHAQCRAEITPEAVFLAGMELLERRE